MYHFELQPNRKNQWERELERLFDVFSKDDYFAPSCEIMDDEKSYKVSLDIPGLTEDEIDIEIKDNRLHVSGERKYAGETTKDYILRSERRYGKFSRVFSLPQNINTDSIEASFQNGVLDITLPKEERSQMKKIKISELKNDTKPDLMS